MKQRPEAPNSLAEAEAYWTPRRRGLVLAVLCLVGMINFTDRQIITVLLQPIKEEFRASDTQMGLLTGVTFAAFYALAGIPIARLADIRTRKPVIAACVALFSLMTSLAGIATGFWMLAASRIGLAIGESGVGPANQSMLMDLYPLQRRAVVIGMLVGMQSIGIGLGVFLGGWLSQAFGWRGAYLIVGAPGLLLALALLLWVREPPRGFAEPVRAAEAAAPPLSEVLARLLRTPSYLLSTAAAGFCGLAANGILIWAPAFMMRVHHMRPAQVGTLIGSATGAALFIGIMLSSGLADWAARKDMRAYLWIVALGPLLAVPLGLCFVWEADWPLAMAAFFGMIFASAAVHPLCYVVSQTVSPVRMRATATAIMGLVIAVMGVGVGPFLIGVVNDALQPRYGVLAIRHSLAYAALGLLAAAVSAALASLYVKADYSRLQRESAAAAGES